MKRFGKILAVIAAMGAVGVTSSADGVWSSRPGADGSRFTEAVERDFRALIDMVRGALDATINAGKTPDQRRYVSIEAIYADRVITEMNGRYWQYGYEIKDVGGVCQVVLGAPVEVVEQYVPATARQAEAPAEGAGGSEASVAAFAEAADGSIAVTLIRAGASGNGNFYSDAALKEAVPLFEGVRVFAKSDSDHIKGAGKDVRNLIGGVYSVAFVEGAAPDTGSLVGTLRPIDPQDAVVTKMTEAVKRGMQGLMGLSIDAVARTKVRTQDGKKFREATKFTRVNSVDLIVEPGAGGGLDRLTEAAADQPPTTTGDDAMKKRLFEAIKAKSPARAATINLDTITDDEIVSIYEAVVGEAASASASAATGAPGTRLTEATGDNAPVTRAELQMFTLRGQAVAIIAASKLPQVAKDRLQAQFASAERFTEADVTKAIAEESAYLARFTESGAVRVPVFGAGSIQVGDRSVQIKDMLDAFFDPAHKDHKQVHSFKECYIEVTGDRQVTGLLKNCDMSRLAESLGEGFRESIASTTFADALGTSITRRMQAIYTGMVELDAWRKVAITTPVNDFRTQERVRIGGYGNLPDVAQGDAYTALNSPGDDKATYAVTKRGGTEDVTMEAIVNDDVQAIRRIPLELALAAKHTLYEFVFDFFRTSPAIHDGVALYHANHGNLFAAALDATAFAAHRIAMLKMTRAGSSKRLATGPRTVLVPFELEETAFNLFVRNQNLDKTFVQTINPEVIPVPYWTDANDWVTVADQNVLPVLEIGFLQGKEDPELFVQDMPNVGSMFSNDKLTYKIRHIYGGAVLVDGEKGTTKAVVA